MPFLLLPSSWGEFHYIHPSYSTPGGSNFRSPDLSIASHAHNLPPNLPQQIKCTPSSTISRRKISLLTHWLRLLSVHPSTIITIPRCYVETPLLMFPTSIQQAFLVIHPNQPFKLKRPRYITTFFIPIPLRPQPTTVYIVWWKSFFWLLWPSDCKGSLGVTTASPMFPKYILSLRLVGISTYTTHPSPSNY